MSEITIPGPPEIHCCFTDEFDLGSWGYTLDKVQVVVKVRIDYLEVFVCLIYTRLCYTVDVHRSPIFSVRLRNGKNV